LQSPPHDIIHEYGFCAEDTDILRTPCNVSNLCCVTSQLSSLDDEARYDNDAPSPWCQSNGLSTQYRRDHTHRGCCIFPEYSV
jgi:hypothetical protein